MSPKELRQVMCGAFEVSEEGEVLLVRTPFGVDFNDDLVLRVRPASGGFRIDDNGDTLLALALNGAAPDPDRVLEAAGDIEFDEEDGSLVAQVGSLAAVGEAVFRVAEAALRVHAACRPRERMPASDLKSRVVELLSQVAVESGVSLRLDEVVEEAGSLTADAVLGEHDPLIVIAASSVERLMEAELLFLRRQISRRPGYVCAVVSSAAAIGRKHFARANYYTDKAVEFDGWTDAFREFAEQRMAVQTMH
ncbi:MAG: hypothetical protein ROZ37_01555 [Aromatoleum sp.]|uniref:hypothetical protein n=1 Tax=Aromatoleum sp. TaxID=2307007 RepID=UPI0028941BA4|nr:hypothetical protein [Aromatoleum sp.]MDT3669000.1 hypothetical protein [Aromatoleum sp.]